MEREYAHESEGLRADIPALRSNILRKTGASNVLEEMIAK